MARRRLHGAPVIDQGVVIGVLVAQLSIDEIDNIVTGGRRWRHEGFGATGEAYLVGSDYLDSLQPRMFFENRDVYFEELKGGRLRSTISRISALRHASPAAARRHQASRAALGGVEGTARSRLSRHPTLASWGPSAFLASSGR
jgi:hypothetical protein